MVGRGTRVALGDGALWVEGARRGTPPGGSSGARRRRGGIREGMDAGRGGMARQARRRRPRPRQEAVVCIGSRRLEVEVDAPARPFRGGGSAGLRRHGLVSQDGRAPAVAGGEATRARARADRRHGHDLAQRSASRRHRASRSVGDTATLHPCGQAGAGRPQRYHGSSHRPRLVRRLRGQRCSDEDR